MQSAKRSMSQSFGRNNIKTTVTPGSKDTHAGLHVSAKEGFNLFDCANALVAFAEGLGLGLNYMSSDEADFYDESD